MDDLDRLILSALQQDGRTPFTHMAKQAGVSETTIRSRYRHLVGRSARVPLWGKEVPILADAEADFFNNTLLFFHCFY